jgi:hypothetical protein
MDYSVAVSKTKKEWILSCVMRSKDPASGPIYILPDSEI